MRRRDAGDWPRIESPGTGLDVPSEIKILTLQQLEELQRRSTGANGRPAWLAERRDSVQWIRMVVQSNEGVDQYRCIVIVATSSEHAVWFSIDLGRETFHALPNVPRPEVVRLAHQFLWSFPMLPLDSDQQATWQTYIDGSNDPGDTPD